MHIVMELMSGGTLDEKRMEKEKYNEQEALEITRAIIGAVK